jgi:putative ABC transport system permease protein
MTSIPFEGLGKGRRIRLDEDDIELIRKRSLQVGEISSEYMDSLQVKLGTRTLAVDVSGVRPAFGEMRNMIPAAGGRFINPIDQEKKRRVAFLGDEIAISLFGDVDPTGQLLRIHGSPFVVIGVLEPKIQDSSYSGRDKDKIIIPASTFRALTGQEFVDNFIFTASEITRTESATDEVLSIIAGKHRFDPADKEALSVWDTSETFQFLDNFMLAFKLFLGVVGSLTLVVGGIGVSNIMNVVVEERTREIGIKMALGAKPRAIMAQFLVETLLIIAVGGAIGIGITALVCAAIPAAGTEDFLGTPVLSPTLALLTVAILGAVGLLAGYFPARDASRLEPVVAMKL